MEAGFAPCDTCGSVTVEQSPPRLGA